MTTKYTPGPWILKVRAGMGKAKDATVADIEAPGPYRGDIARLQSAEHINGIAADEMAANARLIAASPDLLEAAMCALGHLTGNMDGNMDLGDPRDMLRAAIAKAEGRS